MTFLKSAAAALCMTLIVAGGGLSGTDAYAQAKKPTAAEKRAKSSECSAAADKQGLKGKARKAFRSKCKRGTT